MDEFDSGGTLDNTTWARNGAARTAIAGITPLLAASMNLPKGFRLQMTMNVSSGAPFNITTGQDNNGDGSVNDRPAGLGRNANLTPDFYSQPIFNRMICAPAVLVLNGSASYASTTPALSRLR